MRQRTTTRGNKSDEYHLPSAICVFHFSRFLFFSPFSVSESVSCNELVIMMFEMVPTRRVVVRQFNFPPHLHINLPLRRFSYERRCQGRDVLLSCHYELGHYLNTSASVLWISNSCPFDSRLSSKSRNRIGLSLFLLCKISSLFAKQKIKVLKFSTRT
jgi:hypothetical protein